MTDDLRRDKPLVKCPHVLCGRGNKTCQKQSFDGVCGKTHFRYLDEWIRDVASWMTTIRHDDRKGRFTTEEDRDCAYGIYDALAERIETCIGEHVLNRHLDVR
jgi:hypothetical protein